ncbi:MAG TPA: P-loop NTPase fold protein [Longimicrobium sp.]|nr:P-loop NTPase fold protein [Longimicrobium sp.]
MQVWFNAWHYMDTNLWASLASRVFEELAAHFERREIPAEQRNRLFEELEKTRGVLADTVAERTAAEDRRKAITREKEEQAGAVTTIAARAWRAASAALAADPEVQRNLRNARQKLGLDVVETDLAAVRVQAQQIRSLGGRIAAAGRTLARRPVFWLLGVAIFAAVTYGAWWLIAHATLFERASTAVRVVVAALAGLAAGAAPVLAQVSRGLAWLEDVLARLRQQQVVEEQRETQAFEETRARLAEREREAQERVDALTREIDELRAGRRLHRFIVERHASTEYRQHLGLVNLIRNDFEKLSELLSQSRSERKAKDSKGTAAQPAGEASGATPADAQPSAGAAEGENQPPPPLPPIDRIILYIDDLDRCPEDRVVEVLQAVHLLLAFPLFVVVVGVDAGWLVLSLQDHYATLRGRAGESKEAGKPREDEWNTTPQNYLEKIFQIPFTLRPMGSAGFGNLVESLLPAAAAEPAAETSQGAERAASAGKPAPGAETLTRPHGDAGDDEPLPDVDDEDDSDGEEDEGSDEEEKHDPPLIPANPQGLTVEKWERDFVARLHPLIASPRALKRFTNVYRFLRVQRRGADLHRFRGSEEEPGEFQVVALLLAVIVGYPAEAPQLLRAVLTSPGKPWWTLVDEFEASPAAAPAAPHVDDGYRGRATLREALLEVKRTVQMPERPPEVFAQWAREVARFSFQSGRILSLRDQRGDARTDANAETTAAAPG